jgi:hypothetical protein
MGLLVDDALTAIAKWGRRAAVTAAQLVEKKEGETAETADGWKEGRKAETGI